VTLDEVCRQQLKCISVAAVGANTRLLVALRTALIVTAAVFGAALGGCSDRAELTKASNDTPPAQSTRHVAPDETIRYRLSITVSVGSREIKASVVQEIGLSDSPLPVPLVPKKMIVSRRGEALLIDLGERGGLLVPMKTHATEYPYESLLPVSCGVRRGDRTLAQYAADLRATMHECEVSGDVFPMLVRIPDVNTPTLLQKVDRRRLSDAFGNDVALISATIELTNEPLSNVLVTTLPWVGQFETRELFELAVIAKPLTTHLYKYDFIKEHF